MTDRPSTPPSLTRTLIGGAIAGAAAAAAMNGFQALVARVQEDSDGSSEGEPSTVKAADAVSEAVTGGAVAERNKEFAGRAVHYATGVGLGVLYTAVSRHLPAVRSGWGTVYGLAAAAVLDEGLVPALGFGPKPTDVPVATHAYSAISHTAFGLALETATWLIIGPLEE